MCEISLWNTDQKTSIPICELCQTWWSGIDFTLLTKSGTQLLHIYPIERKSSTFVPKVQSPEIAATNSNTSGEIQEPVKSPFKGWWHLRSTVRSIFGLKRLTLSMMASTTAVGAVVVVGISKSLGSDLPRKSKQQQQHLVPTKSLTT